MLSENTITQAPRELGLDQAALYQRGLEHVRALARAVWTDHNVHDPGITQLELLCYALTDLTYRAAFPIEDLLASEAGNAAAMKAQLSSAREILPCRPLTLLDYRKLLIDLPGVKNAWLEPAPIVYFADVVRAELLPTNPLLPGVRTVPIRGVYDVLVELMEDVGAQERPGILADVMQRLHANRNLCEDFNPARAVEQEPFVLCAEVELEPAADLVAVQAEMLFRVQQYLSPPVANYSLAEMLARKHPDGSARTPDEVFEGPALDNGFIDDEELIRSRLRSELRLSDVISELMDIEGVRAVRDAIVMPLQAVLAQTPLADKWVIPVPIGKQPALSIPGSKLVLYKRGMPFVTQAEPVAARYDELRKQARRKLETERKDDRPIPLGTWRAPATYRSVQHHFPEVYGLSDVGLPGNASLERQTQALQLKAYLLFFDQIMASGFAQLAELKQLFSIEPGVVDTYFHQAVTGFRDHEAIYAVTPSAVAGELRKEVGDDIGRSIERRNRFLDHMLARYAERFHDYAAITRSLFGTGPEQLADAKCEFLKTYAETSAQRALASDYTQPERVWNTDNVSGLERRIASLLGMATVSRRNLSEIAHDLYAEIDDTPGDEPRFRVRHRVTHEILLSSTKHYKTAQAAREEMLRALAFGQQPSGYQRKLSSDGKHYFNVVDDTGDVLARRVRRFETEALMNTAIAELIAYLREFYSDEGMYVIEHVLLRPSEPDDGMLPICVDPTCSDCVDDDPYSYRMHVVLPAYASRFDNMDFRRFAEETIREESPAHVLPKICWIGQDDMARLEKVYRELLEVKSGANSIERSAKQRALVEVLYSVKSVYPTPRLFGCDVGEDKSKFILGRSGLGSHDHEEG